MSAQEDDVWDNTMRKKLGNPCDAKPEDVQQIAGLWQALHLFPKEKENIKVWTIITIGMQSAGKTTIVERYLKKAFSCVSSGTATLRPCITEIYPSSEDFSIEVYEEIEGGDGKASSAMLRSLPELATWMKEHNQLSEQPLHVQIRDRHCKTPRRIVDLPGLKTVDQEGSEGTKDQIHRIVSKWITKPRTLVLLMQSAEQEPSASKLPDFIEQFRRNENPKSLDGMVLFPILTRCDMLLRKDGEEVDRRLREWAQVCGVLPLMCGWSLPEDVSAPSPDQRQRHYEKAKEMEGKGLQDFLEHDRAGNISVKCRRYLRESCGFSAAERLLEAHLVAADLKQVQTTVNMLEVKRGGLAQELKDLKAREETINKGALKDRMSRAMHRALQDQQKLSSADGGPTYALLHSDSSNVEVHGKTLEEAEREFQDCRARSLYEFVHNDDIDYTRVGEVNADGFDSFVANFLSENITLLNIDNIGEKLLPGVDLNLKRQAALLRHLTMNWLVRTDGKPQQLLKNLTGPAYEELSNERSVQKGVRFLQVHAARMRPLVRYVMERTCFLMTKVLRMSIDMLQLNSTMKRDIDALGGIEALREAMERGFRKQLKHHASKCYLRATQNHFECTQDLDTVNEEPFRYGDVQQVPRDTCALNPASVEAVNHREEPFRNGEFQQVPRQTCVLNPAYVEAVNHRLSVRETETDKHSKPTSAASPPKSHGPVSSYALLLEEQLFSALERLGAVDMKEFPTVRRGIKQSMTILARSNVHPVQGSHFTCEVFKRLLIQTGKDDFRESLKAEQARGPEDGPQAFSDEPCSKRPLGELFGFGATVLGYIMPKLNQVVINAAQCGLWISPVECHYPFLCDMQEEVDRHIENHDLGASVQEEIERVQTELDKIDEALRACCRCK